MAMSQRELELLCKYEDDLVATLNLSYLLPHLTQCGLITSHEEDLLTKLESTSRESAIKKFLSILKTKGQTAFSIFTTALRNERKHLGHESLYKVLTTDREVSDNRSLYLREMSTINYEPRLSLSRPISQSNSAYSLDKYCEFNDSKLHSDSEMLSSQISHFSSQGSSAAASSLGSEALSNGLASVHSQLNSIKDQIVDNSKMVTDTRQMMTDNTRIMSELTDELKSMQLTLQKSPSSRIARGSPRRRSCQYESISVSDNLGHNNISSKQNTKPLKRRNTTSGPLPIITKKELLPKISKKVPEMDESKLEAVQNITIPSNLLVLPPIIKENEVVFISYKEIPVCDSPGKKMSSAKDILQSFGLQSKQWRSTDISATSSQYQAAFSLLYKDDIAIIRVTSLETHSAKLGIYKLKEMSLWELIPFTNDTVPPVEFKNCRCIHSTRYIVLACIIKSEITFHVHKYASQPWSSIKFSLPTTKTSSELQSCAIVHHAIYCSVKSTEKNHQQKVTIFKLTLEDALEKGKSHSDFESICTYDSSVIQCNLFVASGEVMMMKVIISDDDNRSSTLELSSLSDTLFNFKRQKKDYAFVLKLLSVIPLSTTTYNNHVLIVYYDNRFCKTHLEIFCLPSPTWN